MTNWQIIRGGEVMREEGRTEERIGHSYFQKIIIITIMYVPHNKLKVFME